MAVHRISKGLDLPISGTPDQTIHRGPEIRRVALMGDDTPGVRARIAVQEGDTVKRGQLIYEDRLRPGVRYTAPGAGRVQAIFRGERRVLRSVVIELSASEREGRPSEDELESFASFPSGDPLGWTGDQVRALMVESGVWTALRERPYSKVPLPDAECRALFITAMDTNPLAADPSVVIDEAREEFHLGLRLLAKLCDRTYLCVGADSEVRGGPDSPVQVEMFEGPHPAGTPGLHIHLLAPVDRKHTAWHIGYQDVIALGDLARTGVLPVERVVSLAGPAVVNPRLLVTRMGANFDELTEGEIEETEDDVRLISGSVLSGKKADGPEFGYLGRHHLQVSVIRVGKREFFPLVSGFLKYTMMPFFPAGLISDAGIEMNTDTNGSYRPLFPLNNHEKVMPMDIIPTYLLRALMVGDIEQAEALGALELDEEDLALCTFVDTGKNEFGPFLRANLDRIEKEG